MMAIILVDRVQLEAVHSLLLGTLRVQDSQIRDISSYARLLLFSE